MNKWCNRKEQGTTVSVLSLDCFCYSPLGISAEMKLQCNQPEPPHPTTPSPHFLIQDTTPAPRGVSGNWSHRNQLTTGFQKPSSTEMCRFLIAKRYFPFKNWGIKESTEVNTSCTSPWGQSNKLKSEFENKVKSWTNEANQKMRRWRQDFRTIQRTERENLTIKWEAKGKSEMSQQRQADHQGCDILLQSVPLMLFYWI